MTDLIKQYLSEITTRLERLAVTGGPIDDAIALITDSLEAGGVVQAFGTGHSEAFAMEIAGRAGGLIATNRIALRTLVLRGDRKVSELGGAEFERDPNVGENLLALFDVQPNDVFIIASNSGVNGSILGVALAAKARGHKVIAVTSLDHTSRVTPKHPSGKRLSEIADIVIDNLAPYGDSTMQLEGGIGVGAVSSITAAFIAQRITIGVAETMRQRGKTPPVYISANIPGGDEHNRALEDLYGLRIRREA
ncbi:MAG: sugar isomerase [Devosia sp. 67-54]|mgnify:CR=1 FL=1|uniref:SIS domain-containing protein n=1 Tax=unclassified Devosia TaxID=196773 RepID=UPI00086A27F6|nr:MULTISPECIES: SIS domain-containing protein [unclassified Devosia]MBN9306585.1 SIS domain-containing protein [Devosia sp.]ODU49156.1 MAG: sugar isomerase [Microbacterium sp. SCN 70-10]OJX15867.1 MAG: sugar isomerase [Devosia sp. 67-54]